MLRNTVAYLIARAVPGAISLATLMLLSRRLDPAEYGQYAIVLAIGTISSAIGFHWLCQGVARYAAAWSDRRDALARGIIAAYLMTAAVLCLALVALGAAPAWHTERQFIFAALLFALLQGLFDVLGALHIAQLRPRHYSGMAICKALAAFLVVLILTSMGYGYHAALAGLLSGLALGVVVFNGATLKHIADPRWDRPLLGRMARQGIPLGIHYSLVLVGSLADRALIGYLVGTGATGLYAAGGDLVQQTLSLIMFATFLGFYPNVVREHEAGDDADASRRLRDGLTGLLGVGVPAALGMSMISGNVAHVMLGSHFSETAAGLLPLFAASVFVSAMKSLYTDIPFILAGRGITLIKLTAATTVLSLGLDIVLIPRFGIMAAAVTSVITGFVAIALSIFAGRKLLRLPADRKKIVIVLAAAAFMGVALYPLRALTGTTGLAVQIGAGVGAYGVAAAILLVLLSPEGFRGHLAIRRATQPRGSKTGPE